MAAIRRDLELEIRQRAARSPVVVLTGPRQSGETRLVRKVFGFLPYRNLEAPDLRERALTPKLHFLDSGLVCYLLGIRTPQELEAHPLRGAIFESWVASEIYKIQRNRNAHGTLTFFRNSHPRNPRPLAASTESEPRPRLLAA